VSKWFGALCHICEALEEGQAWEDYGNSRKAAKYGDEEDIEGRGWGLHSSTYQLNVTHCLWDTQAIAARVKPRAGAREGASVKRGWQSDGGDSLSLTTAAEVERKKVEECKPLIEGSARAGLGTKGGMALDPRAGAALADVADKEDMAKAGRCRLKPD
jgi:hypothetical protein